MQFRQKGYVFLSPLKIRAFKSTFDFKDDALTYTFDNALTKLGGTLEYHKIPLRSSSKEYYFWWARYLWVFCATPFAVLMLHGVFHGNLNSALNAFWPFLAVNLLFAFIPKLRKPLTLTTIPSNPPIRILHDNQYGTIRDELASRRLTMIRSKLARLDFNRPYYEELGKFRWLWQEKIISDEEWQQARQQISAMRAAPPPMQPGSIQVN